MSTFASPTIMQTGQKLTFELYLCRNCNTVLYLVHLLSLSTLPANYALRFSESENTKYDSRVYNFNLVVQWW